MMFYLLVRIFLFTFLISIVISKVSLPDLNKITSSKLNECQRCKVLTDSFNNWLEKTSRGKYEGGDAAWEETKLKSYSRSEIRLVEIQEGLCSELKRHQDHCYTLAEEAEQPLEKWWFHEDPASDLHSWLCIETLQYCCPMNHFGDLCTSCPLDKNNKICGGMGECDGDGTRKGNGSCICKKGYAGQHCEQCAKNFYSASSGLCKECHKACDGCSDDGASACNACNNGWIFELGVCTDIDECANPTTCKSNQYCINREGSHVCKACDNSCQSCAGPGSSQCTLCTYNYVLWDGFCVNEKLKNEYITNALKRATLYLGFLLIALYIIRTSKLLSSFVVLIIAIYVYYSEKASTMSIVDVISHLL